MDHRPREAIDAAARSAWQAGQRLSLEGDAVGAALGGQLARAYFFTGNLRRAVEIADPALRTAEHLDLVPIVADTLVTKGAALAQGGRSTEGLALLRVGQELAEKHGLAYTLSRAIANRVSMESSRDPRGALEIGRAGLAAARRLGQMEAVVTENAAWVAVRVGEWAWGLDLLDEALTHDFESADRAELLGTSVVFHAYLGNPTQDPVAEVERLTAGATVLDPAEPEVEAAAGEAARQVLSRLGAKPFLERLEAAIPRASSAGVREPAGQPDQPPG